jgi:hypothetical protein
MLDYPRGRRKETRVTDRCLDSCGPEARELGRATIPILGIDHCGRDLDCGADHGADRQQMADETRATTDHITGADSVKSEKAERIEGQIDEIRETLGILESNLPQQVDGYALSQKSKLPWKVLLYREALIWRIVELGRSALESFLDHRLVSGMSLVPCFESFYQTVADSYRPLFTVFHFPVESFSLAVDRNFLVAKIDVMPFRVRAFAVAEANAAEKLDHIPFVFVCKLEQSDQILSVVGFGRLLLVVGHSLCGIKFRRP